MQEATSVDAFENLDVSFDGISGDGTLKIKNNSTDEFLKGLTYSADKTENLKNGDVVTVTIDYDNAEANNYACIPSSLTKQFTISGLSTYLIDGTKISKASLDEVKDYYIKRIEYEHPDYTTDSWWPTTHKYSNVKVHATYFQCTNNNNGNVLTVIISMDYQTFDSEDKLSDSGQNYYTLKYNNILDSSDGDITLNKVNAEFKENSNPIDSIVRTITNNPDYTTTKLD